MSQKKAQEYLQNIKISSTFKKKTIIYGIKNYQTCKGVGKYNPGEKNPSIETEQEKAQTIMVRDEYSGTAIIMTFKKGEERLDMLRSGRLIAD